MRGTPLVWISALVALAVTGCRSVERCPSPAEQVLAVGCDRSGTPLRLDRGDWAVSERTEVWEVREEREGRPPERIGFLERRQYRQMRGGPAYEVYTVTRTNRRDQIGRVDQLGRAWRYVPQRNEGFEEEDLGVNPLEIGVGKIFQSRRTITLEPTTERRLAFEALDENGDGLLQREEVAERGDRLRAADRNGDGLVDFQEFDAIDVL